MDWIKLKKKLSGWLKYKMVKKQFLPYRYYDIKRLRILGSDR